MGNSNLVLLISIEGMLILLMEVGVFLNYGVKIVKLPGALPYYVADANRLQSLLIAACLLLIV